MRSSAGTRTAYQMRSSAGTRYLVTNDKDRQNLSLIFSRFYGEDETKPTIYVSKFFAEKHKVNRAQVKTCLMDLLEVDNPVVFNFLVDQRSIESVAVCGSQDEAKKITTRQSNVPANMSMAVSEDFYSFFPPTNVSSY